MKKVHFTSSLLKILKKAPAVPLVFLITACNLEAKYSVADSIFIGGMIITMDDKQPVVEAIAVADGKIIAVGDARDVLQHKRKTKPV